VHVTALHRIHRVEREVVDDEHVDREQLAQLGLVRVIEASVLERLEELVGADGEHSVLVPARDVAECVCEEGLANADGANDRDVPVRLDEPHRDELVEQLLVVLHFRRRVPALELHVGLEERALGAGRRCGAVAALALVGEQEEQEVLVRHLLLACKHEALGERVEELAEAQSAHGGLEVGADRIGHSSSPSSMACATQGSRA